MSTPRERADALRARANPIQNHIVDEYRSGGLDRRRFLRLATIAGLSVPAASLLAACGPTPAPGAPGATGAGGRGGTVKAGCYATQNKIDPLLISDQGAVCLVGQTGEYLTLSNGRPELTPVLAEKWESDQDARRWTFTIRRGVSFSDGRPMTAKDVAATFNRLADPANKSVALGVFTGLLAPGGASAKDDTTVVFELEQPSGSFPWLVSSDNYNAIILPADYDGDWEKNWIGTGPFVLESYQEGSRARFVRNKRYWGGPVAPDAVEFSLFEDDTSMLLALQGGGVDVVNSFGVTNGRAILEDTQRFRVTKLRSSAHRYWMMRNDQKPLDDKRVRQAIAMGIDRDGMVKHLMRGYADLGDDSPFAPVFQTTDTRVPQRTRDPEKAKSLLAAAGHGGGLTLEIAVLNRYEIAQLAQLAQSSLQEIGVRLDLKVLDAAAFRGDGQLGHSPELDTTMSIGSWGNRGVPNTFLRSQLASDGPSNGARFHNAEYDQLVNDYTHSVDVSGQRAIAGRIQNLLLEETPAIYPYFVQWLTGMTTRMSGVASTAMGHLLLREAHSG